MKKILFAILVLISFKSFGQVPTGYQKRIVNERIQGEFMVDSAFHLPRYADTTAAMLDKAFDSCGKMFFSYTKDSIYYRACNPKRWIVVGSGSASGKLNISDTASMLANYLRGSTEGYGIDISGTQHKTWAVDSFSLATRARLKQVADSLDALFVNYNFTSLANWDLLRYNSSGTEWVNYKSTFIDNTNPAIKMLVRDTVTGQQYHSIIPTGANSIQELDDLTDLDDADGNAAIIDGRLWIKYTSADTWRRQAYDTTYTPTGSLLLDTYSGAEMAFSLRKIRTAYSGDCIRVRRSSDDAEQDIGFVSGELDVASLTAFVGANDGAVVTWYDQSGNSNDATQSTEADQPLIVISGSIQYVSGQPAIYFSDKSTSGFNGYLTLPTGLLNGATNLSYFHVANIQDFTSSNSGVFGPSNSFSTGLEISQVGVISRRARFGFNGTVRNDNSGAGYQLWVDNAQNLTTVLGNASSTAAYSNSSAVTLTDASAMPALNFNGVYGIGLYASSANTMRGYFQELVIYTTDKTSDRTGIEGNMNTFYTVY